MTPDETEILIDRIRSLSRPLEPIPTGVEVVLPRLPGIRTVVSDLYGTLFISRSGEVGTAAAPDRAAALQQALTEVAGDRVDASAAGRGVERLDEGILGFHARRRGEGVDHPEVDIVEVWEGVLASLASEGIEIPALDRTAIRRLAVEYECRVNPAWPMPGLTETLDRLRKRGMRLGIVSNAQFFSPLLFPACVGRSHPELGFEPTLCTWSYQRLEAKPSPRLFEALLATLGDEHGIRPDEALFVGNDLKNDVGPAAALGMRTALFAGDRRSFRLRAEDPECRGIRPDAVLTELAQVGDVVLGDQGSGMRDEG
jgi:putative hydrolase of the HAD superfamily